MSHGWHFVPCTACDTARACEEADKCIEWGNSDRLTKRVEVEALPGVDADVHVIPPDEAA